MALPHLIKYVYTNGTDEVIRRGKKIHAIGYVELVEYDELFESVTFRVKDDSYATYYKVYVQKFKDAKTLSIRCSCPYNLGDICRHEAGALIQLQELLDRNMLKAEEVRYDQQHTVVKMKFIDLKSIRLLCSPQTLSEAEKYLQAQKARIESAKEEMVKASLELDGQVYQVVIRKNEERNFDTSSNYPDTAHPLCLPKVIVFLQLLHAHGAYYFDSIRNWDKEKNKLLEAYGYSLEDDLKGKFEFTYKEGKPFLRVLDTSIKRVAPLATGRPKPAEAELAQVSRHLAEEDKPAGIAQRLGIVFNFNHEPFPGFALDAIAGESNEEQSYYTGKVEKMDLTKFINTDSFNEFDRQIIPSLRKMQTSEINKYLNRNSPFSGIWENIIHHEEDDLPEETKKLMVEYLHPKLRKLFAEVNSNPFVFYLNGHKPFKTANLQPVGVSGDAITPFFNVSVRDGRFEIVCFVKINGQPVDTVYNECGSSLVFFYNNNLYLWNKPEDITLVERFSGKTKMIVEKSDWPKHLKEFILPLTKDYHVEFDQDLVKEVKDGDPEKRLLLQEKGDYLVFQPLFSYKGYETRPGGKDEIIVPDGQQKCSSFIGIKRPNCSSLRNWNRFIRNSSIRRAPIAWH